jgi:rhodanese-related sulfurtransferase
MTKSISVEQLIETRALGFGPQIIDVRRPAAYESATHVIPGAIHRDPDDIASWWKTLDLGRDIVVYCVHGHEVSQGATAFLIERGIPAVFLEGGFEGWRNAGAPLAEKPGAPTIWVTRERPKIDRIACPWLIRRFIDPGAVFHYVPAPEVVEVARTVGGIPYDIPGVEFTHVGERCSFDTFIARYRLDDPALLRLADAVRGADTDRLELAAPAAGLFAISLGLSANIPHDHEMLRHGLVIYDALYRWYRDQRSEPHIWPPRVTA